jgi:carboxymethylenebutenolidase
MESKIIDLYDDYNSGTLDRREFIKRLSLVAGGALAATSLLPLLESNYALGAMVPKNDERLISKYVNFPGTAGDIRGNLVTPKAKKKYPGVLVIHENRGLNPHIEDVARRIALEGFVALAPDGLSPMGGTPADQDKARDMIRKLDVKSNLSNFMAAVKYLKNHPQTNGNIGCMGFCWGGGLANQLAVNSPDLKAAVPYYGRQPSADDVSKIKASLLLHYGGTDKRINAGIEAYETALISYQVDYQMFIYKGAPHAFNNDTNVSRYHKEAATLAWKRTVDFFKIKL